MRVAHRRHCIPAVYRYQLQCIFDAFKFNTTESTQQGRTTGILIYAGTGSVVRLGNYHSTICSVLGYLLLFIHIDSLFLNLSELAAHQLRY